MIIIVNICIILHDISNSRRSIAHAIAVQNNLLIYYAYADRYVCDSTTDWNHLIDQMFNKDHQSSK